MSSQQNNEASIVTAIKDQAVGAIKEVIGSVIGNTQMELEGKAQKVHGQNEYDFAKAAHSGEAEPEKFQRAYHSDAPNESEKNDQPVESDPSQLSGLKDQALGAMKSTMGAATGNQDMELKGKAQNIHGRNEAEFAKAQRQGLTEPEHFGYDKKSTDQRKEVEDYQASSLTAAKDVTVGAMKEAIGAATGNTNTEIAGLAQQMRGKNEAEFVKAQNQGLSEPEHFAHGTKTTTCDQAKGEVEDQKVSSIGAIKDKVMGSMKEMVGSLTGNQDMELKGKAQNIHGHHEAEFAQAQKQGLNEPEHFAHGTNATDPKFAQGEVDSQQPSMLAGWKDQAVGAMKGAYGAATGNPQMELIGKAQNIHGRNEAEFAKAQMHGLNEPEHFVQGRKTTDHFEKAEGEVEPQNFNAITAVKDVAVGLVKEAVGTATGNTNTEIAGLAQQMHGRNEAEFLKAENQGLSEPEHYAHGTKTTTCDQAKGEVESEKVSNITAMKDKAMGSMKEMVGTFTGNQDMELKGKAQNIHGHHEAEFAQAQKQGLNEPEHFAHGTKTTDHAEATVESQEPSKLSGWKDQAVGAAKETLGSATNNQKMEIEGKAQKMHGSNQCAFADTEKNPINA